jgi:hypothetical protein
MGDSMNAVISVLLMCVILPGSRGTAENEMLSVSAGTKDGDGFLRHEVKSPYQAGTTRIRVLSPEKPGMEKNSGSFMSCRSRLELSIGLRTVRPK